MELINHSEMYGGMSIYKDVSCDYRGRVFDLIHEYHILCHYIRSWASSFTYIHAKRATYQTDSKYHK
jgi:hypothetical protein